MRTWLLLVLAFGLAVVANAQLPKRPRPFLILADSTPPNVFFSPSSGYTDTSSASPNVTVTISFGDKCQLPSPPGGPDSITFNGQDVRSLFTYSGGGGGPACTGATAQAVGTIPLRFGTNADTLRAVITNGGARTGAATAIYSYLPVYHAPPRHQLRITVAAGATHGAPGSRVSVPFTVTNIGNTIDTVYTKNHCNGAALSPPTHCFTSPDSAFGLPPGGTYSGTAFVDLGTTLGSTGRLETIAYERSRSGVTDTAYTDITVQNPLGPGVVLNTVTGTGTTVPREQCLTIEIRPGVAYQCGDLRIAHVLPAVRTYNQLRTPHLVYHSNIAHGHTALGALVTFDSTKGTPDTVTVTVVDSATGATVGSGKWLGSSWVKGRTQRVTVNVDESNTANVRWAYTFTATAKYDSLNTTQSFSATGAEISVSGVNGSIGELFMLAGVENLVVTRLASTPWTSTPPLLWHNSEGDTRQYNPVPGDSMVWAAPGVDRPDTIKLVASDGFLHRYAEHGGQVIFDGRGNELKTIDRLGHIILVDDGDLNVSDFTVPSPSGGLRYTYKKNSNGSEVDTIIAPANGTSLRKVVFGYDAVAATDTIYDLDGSFDVYHFTQTGGHGGPDHLLTSYQDKRGTITRFYYDSAYKLIKAIIDSGPQIVVKPAVPSLNLTWTFVPAESRGLTTPVSPDSAYTLVTAPRGNQQCFHPLPACPDSLDQTRYWVDQWGEPTRIRDAHGYETELGRTNATYPSLVTYLRFPNGRVNVSTYDPRGNDSTLTDSSTVIGGVAATTVYRFDHKWDFDTLTTLPLGVQQHIILDPATGNRVAQQSGSDPARQVTFAYGSYGLVTSVTQPLSPAATITYDHTLGNDSTVATALGFTDSTYQDAIGRDTMEVSPNDSAQRQFAKAVKRYDIMDRVTDAIASAQQPAAETSFVHTHYTVDGLVDSVEKWSSPDIGSIQHIRTSTQFDAAGRTIVQVAQDGTADTLYLDAAGNVVTHVTRRGFPLTSVYDALNRLVVRVTPSVTVPMDTIAIDSTSPPTYHLSPRLPNCNINQYCIPTDSATFAYDAVGSQVAALNGDAWVRRQYNQNGTLATDSLWIRTVARIDSGGNFTTHVYGVSYTYDLDRRRTAIGYPAQLVLALPSSSAKYAYDTSIGVLDTITDLFGNQYSYTFDAAQRVVVTRYPGTITDSVGYDSDSRVTSRLEQAHYGSTPPTKPFSGPLRAEASRYDARGKLTYLGAIADTLSTTYSGLGHADSTRHACVVAGGSCDPTYETWQTDAQGHQVEHVTMSDTWSNREQMPETFSDASIYRYLANTDRVTNIVSEVAQDPCDQRFPPGTIIPVCVRNPIQYTYDLSGNQIGEASRYKQRHVYGADEKERLVDAFGDQNAHKIRPNPFEETRYDALGRRIWRRSRLSLADFTGTATIHSDVQRFIWDGTQLLFEVRALGSDSVFATAMESDTTTQSPHLGGVAYINTEKVDRPIAIQRFGYSTFAPFSLSIYYSFRGQPDTVSLANGAWTMCTADGTLCVGTGMNGSHFIHVAHVGAEQAQYQAQVWNGSLLMEQQNAAGGDYKRNRYYDPITGQFTQEDPKGLAGGLNAYGFGSGDPVNYDDPFGLDSRNIEADIGDLQIVGAQPAQQQEAFSFSKLAENIKNGVKSTVDNAVKVLDAAVHHPGEAALAIGKGLVKDALDFGPKAYAPAAAAAAFPPGMRKLTGKSGWSEVTKNLAENHGISEFTASERLHALKAAEGIPADANLVFGYTGDVFTELGEWVGMLTKIP